LFNQTPLHWAAINGHLSVVEYLVNHNAEINVKNKDGETPLELAKRYGRLNVVDFLKSRGNCRI